MKHLFKLPLLAALVLASSSSVAFAQRQLGKPSGPTGKLFLAETQGQGQITSEGKAYEPRQAMAFTAPGAVIETKEGAHQAFVYSNGTGMYVDASTRVEIARFAQEPFLPDRSNTEREPSISRSDIFVARGLVALCTSQLVSGSTMNYSTPQALVSIRGRRVIILSAPNETRVYLLEGDVSVRVAGGRDVGGKVLAPGEMAVIQNGAAPSITLGPIDSQLLPVLEEKLTIACNARKTVAFETVESQSATNTGAGQGGDEIVARPTVTANPPSNLTVSPSRL